jgi:glutaredoxin
MEFLSHQGIEFTAKDISTDLDARRELIELGSRSTPTITVDGQPVVGFDVMKLRRLLELG